MIPFYFKLNINTVILCFVALVSITTTNANAQVITIETGIGTTAISSPYYFGSRSKRHQYLYSSAQLYAAGAIVGQTFNKIAWYVTTGSIPTGYTVPNWTIKAAWTTQSSLGVSAYSGTLTTIYQQTLTSPGVVNNAWNTYNLSSQLSAWNGSDNLVIEVCNDLTTPTNITTGSISTVGSSSSGTNRRNFSNDTNQCSTTLSSNTGYLPNIQLNMVCSLPNITISGSQYVCQGGSTTLIASGGTGYTWGPSSALANTLGSTVTALPVNSTTYTVTATYGSNCTTQSTYIVNVNPLPPLPVTAYGDTICTAGFATVTAAPPSGNYSIRWFQTATGGYAIATTNTFTDYYSNTTTLYSATINNATGCLSNQRVPATVLLYNLQGPIASDNYICSPGAATLNAIPASPANTCRWYININDTNPFFIGTNLSNIFTGTTAYYVSSYDTLSGCESFSRIPINLVVHTLSTPQSPTVSSICEPGNATVSALPAPNVNNSIIHWYDTATGGTLLGVEQSYSQYFSQNTTLYAATYNQLGNCESENRLPVQVYVNPVSTSDLVSQATYGNDGSIVVNVITGVPPYSYDWDNDGTGDFDDLNFIDGLIPGVYKLKIRDARNCYRDMEYYINCCIFIPTGMSPNGDGKNDNWEVKGIELFEDLSISVFNLQGQLVHYQRNNYIPWNGTINGVMAPVGDYYFVIESIPNKIRKTGTLTISY
jgi:gliding motility-associated-like protein